MTKADLVDKVHSTTSLSKKESYDLLETVFEVMKSTLESGENIKLSCFGSFEIKQKKERTGRNPVTGESVTIDARRILTFKPSAVLKSTINGKSQYL